MSTRVSRRWFLLLGLAAACGNGGSASSTADAPFFPPPPADAPPVSPTADAPQTSLGPRCGNGIVETGERCDGASGCAAGEVCSGTCDVCQPPPAPTQTPGLIALALAQDQIDYFTSLLYRAYALVGDDRLPPEYDGDFTVTEDTVLFFEIAAIWGSLTADQQQQLLPYVVRPTDPASFFSTAPPGPAKGFASPDDVPPPPLVCPTNSATHESDWRAYETAHFVVWTCGGGDPSTDPYVQKRLVAGALAEEVWVAETAGMGPPRPDTYADGPEPRSRIDVYLLADEECRFRNGKCWPVTGSALAAAPPDAPCDRSTGPLTSSGYLLLRRSRVPDTVPDSGTPSKIRSDFAHEFFHLLSFGRNLGGQGGVCRDGKFQGRTKISWLTEASGTWAEWAYFPDDDADDRTKWFNSFQGREPMLESLNSAVFEEEQVGYAAYVYPLFLCQDGGGGPSTFEGFWTSNGSANNVAALDDVLDQQFSFEDKFRDFAVRDYNVMLSGDPIAPLLHAADAAATTGVQPTELPSFDLQVLGTDEESIPLQIDLMPLAAQYQHFSVPDEVRWVDVDLNDFADPDKVSLDALASDHGEWSRRRPDGPRWTFCRDDPDDDIGEFWLVISNHAHKEGDKASGPYKIKTATICPSVFTGSIHAVRLHSSHAEVVGETDDGYERLTETWTLGGATTVNVGVPMAAVELVWNANYVRHDSTVTPASGDCQRQPVIQTIDGSGGGSKAFDVIITPIGNGNLFLSPFDADIGSFDAPLTYFDATCDGSSQSTTSMNTVADSYTELFEAVMLSPSPDDPHHYVGSTVFLHSENPLDGGEELIDWKISWDVQRSR